MKITYTKAETLALMKRHIADLLDVEISEIAVSNYSTDFLEVTCTQAGKKYAVDESYEDPA